MIIIEFLLKYFHLSTKSNKYFNKYTYKKTIPALSTAQYKLSTNELWYSCMSLQRKCKYHTSRQIFAIFFMVMVSIIFNRANIS